MELKKDTVLQNYTIIEPIGEGGMGEVYLAEETILGRQVAIKRLNPSLTNDAHFSERFVNEARIQARMTHPNIVALYNFFVDDGVYYMVMEYAEGNMLKELIAMTGPIPEPRALHIFKQIINALAYAHSKAIIHRDIKPSNIMIDASDNVKIMDFGIARLMTDKHLTRTGSKLGTLFYMSPEQVKARKDIDHRTDIYSAGVVLYEMLTGKLPYTADTDSDFDVMLEIVNNELPDPRTIYPHIGDSMVQLVSNMTAKDKQHRPDTGKIKTKLEQFEGKHIFYPEEANKPFIKEKSIPAAPEPIFQAPAAVEQPLDDVSHKVPWNTESPESYTPKTSSTKLRNMLLIIGSIVIFILIFLWIRTSNNAPSIDPVVEQIVSVPETEIGDTSMIFVQGDSFKMGSNDGESDEKPVHQV
ncbi:MAG: serine/threonine-protein kinase, partial [Candidatus Cloacimonadaceae bacterium]|nr:serine/threonine-protein kinase [Candidatus Cloacimonadaceae bacterium]